jgi:hypothetical protein
MTQARPTLDGKPIFTLKDISELIKIFEDEMDKAYHHQKSSFKAMQELIH